VKQGSSHVFLANEVDRSDKDENDDTDMMTLLLLVWPAATQATEECHTGYSPSKGMGCILQLDT
jgi:hypothetical protein